MAIDYDAGKITVTKIDAAQRQPDTAIQLWFSDGDPVAIHTLASASHEIIDHLYKKSGLRHLLFDPPTIAKEHRNKWATQVRRHYNFFKHARHDDDKTIDFKPAANEFIIFFSVRGLHDMKFRLSFFQDSFRQWHFINRPEMLMPGAYDRLRVIGVLDEMRSLSKQEFLHQMYTAWNSIQRMNG
jgi:hypothetical protein